MTNTVVNNRLVSDNESSLGLCSINGHKHSFVIEDEARLKKVKGETRIPAGTYKLGIRKVASPMTKRYRQKYHWFKFFIVLIGVPNFTYVYFHIGNKETHTDACQLLGYGAALDENNHYRNTQSAVAVKDFYEKIYPLLERGEEVEYHIIDHDQWCPKVD